MGGAGQGRILERFAKIAFVPGHSRPGTGRSLPRRVDCAGAEPVAFFSRVNPRVSFVGEASDVAGLPGGFNLHWTFASGWLAAEALARRLAS